MLLHLIITRTQISGQFSTECGDWVGWGGWVYTPVDDEYDVQDDVCGDVQNYYDVCDNIFDNDDDHTDQMF